MATAEDGSFELVLGSRQVACVLFIAAAFVGICAAGSYVAGRAMTVKEEAAQAAAKPQASQPEAVPVRTAAATAVPKVSATPVTPPPSVTLTPPATIVQSGHGSVSTDPETGYYLQVGTFAPGVAEVFAVGLGKKGYRAAIIPAGPPSTEFRVLVGPLDSSEKLAAGQAELEKVGFRPFVRRYVREKSEMAALAQ